MFRKIFSVLVCVMLICGFSGRAMPQEAALPKSKGQSAFEAAQAWLSLVDRSYYGTCWDVAGFHIKRVSSKAEFSAQLSAVRSPLGELISREIVSKKYQTTMPGFPDGEYFLFSFSTVFSRKARAFEALTMVQDSDGQWRMTGYYIK